MRSPWTAAAFVTVALAAAPAPASAGARHVFEVPRAAPGTIAVAGMNLTTRVSRGTKATPRLRLRFPKATELPPSVRILWAKRRVRRGRRVTFSVLFMSINVATATARAAQEEHELRVVDLVNMTLSGPWSFTQKSPPVLARSLVGDSPVKRQLIQLFQTSWLVRIGQTVFEDETQTASELDTGHYDDGHAFGWRPAGQKDAWASLKQLNDENLDAVVAEIETRLEVDIDGDGSKGKPVVDTTVGPPVITTNP